ncbi:MAG: dihydrodipicolinate synthase family protein, partial [Alphaproteobacteria bacterium]|nr:dihydrodipicolinate synthase family protein [Alphaproteobacteria bacterium]
IPQNTGFAFTLPMVKRMKARFGPIIAGMKDSSGDFANMAAFAREIPEFRVFAGSEHFLLDILKAGGVGCISATTNVTAAFAQKVCRSRAQGDQDRASALRLAIQKRPLIPAMKGLVARYLGDPEYGRMLPPNLPMAESDIAALADELAALGLEGMA